jgi:glutamate---cysteine ligase / carboxylate-amine ligase
VKSRIGGDPVAVADTPSVRDAFEADAPMTVGLEEELMVLDAATYELLPRAHAVLARLHGDARFKPELPAAQLEIALAPATSVPEAAQALAAARGQLAAAAAVVGARVAGAGVHPFAAAEGVVTPGERYDAIVREYGPAARRQLVFGLHVHVAVRGPQRALAVYNAVRSYLPELAALAANAPIYRGADSGLASVRPKLRELLPRQAVPPAFGAFEDLDEALRWGYAAGALADRGQWWWEARLHPIHGTVEVRVPDTQATTGEAAAVASVVHALVADLAARHDAGEHLPVAPSWRIAENRWSACRHGLDGTMADLETGARAPTRERLRTLLDRLEPAAAGVRADLGGARALLEANGADRQRAVARDGGPAAVASWLAERFLG